MRKKVRRKTDRINKLTSTQEKPLERKMSINLMEGPPTDKNNNNNNEEKTVENIIERSESEENLIKAIEETENLRKKIKEKNEEFEKYKIKDESELILINKNIKEKSEKLENISYNTKILINKLNLINTKINEEYNKAKIIQAANKIKINYLNKLKLKEKKITNKGKKIIFLNNKIIDKFKIQKDKLEKIIEEDKSSKIKDYKSKLEELKKEEKNIIKEIEDLRLKKQYHEKKCIQINENLNKILERLRNEHNDEYKTKENTVNKRKNSISESSMNSLPKIIRGNILTTPTKEYISIIENKISSNNSRLNSKNYKSLTDLFGQDYFIQKDLKELKNQIRNNVKSKLSQKLKRYITSYSENNRNNHKSNEKNNLFSKLEKDMLSKIIPQECLERYQDKFKTIENERIKIKTKLNKNEKKKN